VFILATLSEKKVVSSRASKLTPQKSHLAAAKNLHADLGLALIVVVRPAEADASTTAAGSDFCPSWKG
jgi:hypothetical protein